MPNEPFPFADGTLHLWTGAATASGSALTHVQQTHLALVWGWRGDPSLSGVVRDHLTGQRADMAFVGTFNLEHAQTVARIAASATAVHLKFTHTSIDGSAGYVAHSARIDSLTFDNDHYTLSAHAHTWSAF